MRKLELKELKGYLGTGVNFLLPDTHIKREEELTLYNSETLLREQYPLILHPISDLTKYCDDLGFVPSNLIDGTDLRWLLVNDINEIKLYTYNWLLERHFDIHNLIPDNLAIDINTIK